MVDALAEPIQPRPVPVFDLIEPDRHLCESGAEVAHRGAFLLALGLARDRRQTRLDDINS
ncbi:MAG: hypothetical protein JO223_10850 [Hyphomicrobiales bacterium]|nr:hypothetical protein [Hyphomicrobiales bacterium]